MMRCKVTLHFGVIFFLLVLYCQLRPAIAFQNIDVTDTQRLQRGAGIYMNYCSGCHSLRYMRYNQLARGIGLTIFSGEIDEDLLQNNLIYTTAKKHEPIFVSMPEEDARQWFGKVPPDLSLSARQHGSKWLYDYLHGFYADPNRPFGANNVIVPDVAMPNVLAPLQGEVVAEPVATGFLPKNLILINTGTMTQHQFDSMLEDLVTFLVYVGDPTYQERIFLGKFVLLFLAALGVLVYLLKRLYWKNISKD